MLRAAGSRPRWRAAPAARPATPACRTTRGPSTWPLTSASAITERPGRMSTAMTSRPRVRTQSKRGAAPARGGRRALLEHHAALDQLAHQRRHRAPVHLHPSRELGARDRLILADQVEDDAPVDLPGSRSRREAKVARVDLTHGQGLRSERERGDRVVWGIDHRSGMRVAGRGIARPGGKTAARPVDCT